MNAITATEAAAQSRKVRATLQERKKHEEEEWFKRLIDHPSYERGLEEGDALIHQAMHSVEKAVGHGLMGATYHLNTYDEEFNKIPPTIEDMAFFYGMATTVATILSGLGYTTKPYIGTNHSGGDPDGISASVHITWDRA